MATIAQVENILLNTKSGQFVVASCPGTSESLEGYVVNLDPQNLKVVSIANWTKGWPDAQD